jgi:UDP:flavonoid glycosyltransferase YjiC (YdhE family)
MAAVMVLAAGSTGDVEPFAALAGRLAGRGHDVTLAADAGRFVRSLLTAGLIARIQLVSHAHMTVSVHLTRLTHAGPR